MSVKKRLVLVIGLTPVITHAFLPVCTSVAYLLGYNFSLFNYTFFAVVNVIVTVVAVVTVLIRKELFVGKVFSCLFALSLPLCVADWLCYLFQSDSPYSTVCILISFICVVVINVRIREFKATKIILSLLSILFFAFLVLISFMGLTFGKIGTDTVVNTLSSPDGRYYAEVIDVDQGALGGNTVVEVSGKREIDLIAFRISEIPQRVFIGEWGEHKDMEIYWKNDTCLVINSTEYVFK